ncbi:MAG: STAS domain-containing protein [Nitrospirae bacterium]|nr:STAS domain-containing protein [Nitrospirota bacterium]
MAEIEIVKEKDADVVVIRGEMTIECAGALRDALLRSLGGSERVILDLGKVTAVDLSCLQLLCSAHRTSLSSAKAIALKQDYPGILKEAVRENGYSRCLDCRSDSGQGCFWKGI